MLVALDGGREGGRDGGIGLFSLLGGRGGNSASLYAGARTLLLLLLDTDDAPVPVVLPVLVETVESEFSDAVDSSESLRCNDGLSDNLRGKAAGVFLDGNGGGTLAGLCTPFPSTPLLSA